jgi:hypothetical protein
MVPGTALTKAKAKLVEPSDIGAFVVSIHSVSAYVEPSATGTIAPAGQCEDKLASLGRDQLVPDHCQIPFCVAVVCAVHKMRSFAPIRIPSTVCAPLSVLLVVATARTGSLYAYESALILSKLPVDMKPAEPDPASECSDPPAWLP